MLRLSNAPGIKIYQYYELQMESVNRFSFAICEDSLNFLQGIYKLKVGLRREKYNFLKKQVKESTCRNEIKRGDTMAKEVFQRKEIKYLMNEDQYQELRKRLDPIACVDAYGKTQILNTYFDQPDFGMVRKSLEHPVYKEKLRLRCYGIPSDTSSSFVEIKKKYKGIVYKRRIELPYCDARNYLWRGMVPLQFREMDMSDSTDETTIQERQIQKEIDYFLHYYKNLRPAMGIAYDRIALAGREDPNLRITFDTNIRWSVEELDLRHGNHGYPLLEEGQHLMEIKIGGAMDLRIAHMLNDLGIFETSISKYGRGYQAYIQQQREESTKEASFGMQAVCFA